MMLEMRKMVSSARRGLEPHFRVLFSAIFHGVSCGISIRGENRRFLWKEKCCKLLQIYVQIFSAF